MPNVTAFKHIVCCATIFVLLKQIQLKVIFGNVSVHDNFILSKNLSIFRSTSKSRPNNIGGKMSVRLSVRPYVRTSVRPSIHKKFLRFE